ncbi:efflux RND transporter periplasmic adaptor subunit [Stutzerimonas kunmingensis]|uniref:efflux RND transporter periplasmic adaptor subunit n=1 Tax=Stutzerimonas kunmingensis TaxID=1211807 RepID=UPI0028AC27E9|nr:HlyD family efflux transporter periplasmic adaptor subunit [Stutzerimonas kunmingensis]
MSTAVAALLGLEQQLRKASDLAQLFYTLVNQTGSCVPYTQSLLLVGQGFNNPRIEAASDIPTIDYTSPFINWAERLSREILAGEQPAVARVLKRTDVSENLAQEWREFGVPDFLLWQPLLVEARENEAAGALLMFREQDWSEAECAVSLHMANTAGHALFALRRHLPLRLLLPRLGQRKILLASLLGLVVVMSLPVRLSTLAPVTVIPAKPHVVATPLDGVIEEVLVSPNQLIEQGEVLARLDSGELKSEASIAQQSLLVAKAELKTVQQSGFLDPRQKSRLAELEAQVGLRALEWARANERLARSEILSEMAGVAVLDDPAEWRRKPVKVGERILLVADPEKIEFEIMLPVKDSIALLPGTDVTVFLDNDPIQAWSARLRHAAYEPRSTPEQTVAYRLIADLESVSKDVPRIGLRGTARVYGERVSLFFYIFRRPLTTLRQWVGW